MSASGELMDLAAELNNVRDEALAALASVENDEQLEALRVAYLGRNGKMKALSKAFAGWEPPGDEASTGKLLGSVNEALRDGFTQVADSLACGLWTKRGLTSPAGTAAASGLDHPIAQVASEVERVFTGMGFDVVDGPHIEEDKFNFSLLNIPDHPARSSRYLLVATRRLYAPIPQRCRPAPMLMSSHPFAKSSLVKYSATTKSTPPTIIPSAQVEGFHRPRYP